MFQENKACQIFRKNEHFLFGVLSFLETPVLRFVLLAYYGRYETNIITIKWWEEVLNAVFIRLCVITVVICQLQKIYANIILVLGRNNVKKKKFYMNNFSVCCATSAG